MGAQSFDRIEIPCQLRFGQGGVDLFVADHMQKNRGAALAPFQFWDQMLQAAVPIGDRPFAEGADRVAVGHISVTSRRRARKARGQQWHKPS